MVADDATPGRTLGPHRMQLLRGGLDPEIVSCADLPTLPHEAPVRIGGLVVARQRPGTAKGIVFILLEDEFGTINLIVPPPVYERHRLLVRSEPLLLAEGRLERLPQAGGAINVYVRALQPLVAPGEDVGDVVALAERRAAEAAAAAADFRGVAPAVQSFAAGRRR
jgi:error-prone DNA polymerase